MYLRIVSAAAVLLMAAGCAGSQNAQPTETRERLGNRGIFDVAVCHAGADYTVPEVTTEGTLTGALLLTRPLIFNCLADPQNRGEARETLVKLTATVEGASTTFDVEGDNVTESGRACIRDAVSSAISFKPLEEGAAPVTASMDIPHEVGANAAVVMGINEPSDIVGTIRLAEHGWCDCFGDDPQATPDSFIAQVAFAQEGTQVERVTMFRLGDEPPAPPAPEEGEEQIGDRILTEDPVAQCLAQKLRTVTFSPTTQAWQLPYAFEFINTLSDTPAANATPNARVQQLDARRAAAQSNSIMVAEKGNQAREAYAALVNRYNQNSRSVPVPDLVSSCERLTQANDAFIVALEAQQHAEQRIQDYATSQLAEDAGWQGLIDATTKMQEGTATNLANAKTQRDADQQSCPKIQF